MQKVYLGFLNPFFDQGVTVAKEPKSAFKDLLVNSGYGEKLADLLWEWYDFTDKKGVASF